MDALACFMLSTDYERRSSECWESPLQAPTLVSEPGQSIDRIDEQHAPDALHSKELSCMRGCSLLVARTSAYSLRVQALPKHVPSSTSCTRNPGARTSQTTRAASGTVTVYFSEEDIVTEAQPKENIVEVPYLVLPVLVWAILSLQPWEHV